MTIEPCECLGYGTDDHGRMVCLDCGEPLFPTAAPIGLEMMEMVRKAQEEHNAALMPSPFTYRH
jgi:hypothetical protein